MIGVVALLLTYTYTIAMWKKKERNRETIRYYTLVLFLIENQIEIILLGLSKQTKEQYILLICIYNQSTV